MALGQAVDDVGEIGLGIKLIQLCGLKSGIEDSCPVAAGLGAEK